MIPPLAAPTATTDAVEAAEDADDAPLPEMVIVAGELRRARVSIFDPSCSSLKRTRKSCQRPKKRRRRREMRKRVEQ
jgi:hypothetical protein